MKNPKVTVLMPVYNGEMYIREAIESILSQTFKDFEFLIINDGSTDRSIEIIASYSDERIRLVHNSENIKLIASLNRGLDLARGEYVARMDCDDISLPDRLKKQVEFMDAHPEIGICGTWIKTIGKRRGMVWRYATENDMIKCGLLFGSVIVHASAIMRKAMIDNNDLRFDHNYPHAEDLQFFQEASKAFKLANLGEILFLVRFNDNSVSSVFNDEQMDSVRKITHNAMKQLNISSSSSELSLHRSIASCDFHISRNFISEAEAWLIKLYETNKKVCIHPQNAFEKVIGDRWYVICYRSSSLGFWVWKKYWKSPLSKMSALNKYQKSKFLVKCGIKYRYS